MAIALGPFDLLEPVAHGGMAEVWRGVHRASRVPVAVKVVTPPAGREDAYRDQFVHEVQAMAGLRHPAVVRLHEYGQIDPTTARISRGRLPEGAPFLAMEWLDGGTLSHIEQQDWPRLRAILLTLLDALAHAHARGVVHRDLKPDNVLLGDRGPVLTDFGLAVNPVSAGASLGEETHGTPGYMAPEQIRNDWRAFGPWTDLYALGCLAYELVCGFAPHADVQDTAIGLLVAHLQDPQPRLRPRIVVPAAFEQWLVRLMGRTPHARFQFAADAAVALLAISDEPTPTSSPTTSVALLAPAMPFAPTMDAPGSLALAVVAAGTLDRDEHDHDSTEDGGLSRELLESMETDGPKPSDTLGDETLPPGGQRPTTAELILDLDRDTVGPMAMAPEFDDAPDAAEPGASIAPLAQRLPLTRPLDQIRPPTIEPKTIEPKTVPPPTARPPARGEVVTRPAPDPAPRTARPTQPISPVFLPVTDTSWASGPNAAGRPPLPASWRREQEPEPPPMIDVGLTLAQLREPPPMGRDTERNHLWSALRSAVRGRARAVIIQGASGRGKTHLAGWLAHRAHELGVADHLHAVHQREPSAETGPAAMVARYLRCAGLDGDARRARIEAALGPHGTVHAIAAVAGALAEAERKRTEGTIDETRIIDGLLEGLTVLAARRPVVLWCDDGQWARRTLAVIDAVLDRRPELPLLALITVRDDQLGRDSAAARLLDLLARRGSVTRLQLGALPPVVLFQMVHALVPLAPNLVDRLADRSGGNPQFALDLVRHWVASGAVESGPSGFRLRGADRELSLPGERHAIWLNRLAETLRGVDDPSMQAIELAAVLGLIVDPEEWSDVCDAAGLPRPQAALARLLGARLVRSREDGRWGFAHAMLREALLQRARSGGRWVRWNGLVARVLGTRSTLAPARLAEHLLAAGDLHGALGPLLAAADDHLDRADHMAAIRALSSRIRAQRTLRLARGGRAWVEITLRWAHAHLISGAPYRAIRHARRAVLSADRLAMPELEVQALIELGRALSATDGPDAAWGALGRALERLPRLDDAVQSTRLRSIAGACLVEQGRFDAAERTLRVALAGVKELEQPRLLGDVLRTLADLARRRGRLDQAERFITQAGRAYYRSGARRALARAALVQGDLERDRGNLSPAGDRYREAGRMLRAVGAPDAPLADIGQALVLVELEQYREARSILLQAVERSHGRRILSARVHACLLPSAAWSREWMTWDRHWTMAGPIRAGAVADPDIARVAALAARLADRAGERGRARAARRWAVDQLMALGRAEDADDLLRGS